MLWKIPEHILKPNGFDFNKIVLREINTEGYTLYQTAKIISTGKEYIKINWIADADLIDTYHYFIYLLCSDIKISKALMDLKYLIYMIVML